jgi:hypothetical protein
MQSGAVLEEPRSVAMKFGFFESEMQQVSDLRQGFSTESAFAVPQIAEFPDLRTAKRLITAVR